MAKKRGRPANADQPGIAAADEAIAKAVSQLMFWGFSQDAVCECVGKMAAQILKRTDHTLARGLGADRIEQIYEKWLSSQPKPNFARGRCRYRKRELARRRPGVGSLSLRQLASRLLQNAGQWPVDPNEPFVPFGDPDLTPKAHADYLRNRIKLTF